MAAPFFVFGVHEATVMIKVALFVLVYVAVDGLEASVVAA